MKSISGEPISDRSQLSRESASEKLRVGKGEMSFSEKIDCNEKFCHDDNDGDCLYSGNVPACGPAN
jgi:hypothetical protein